MKLTLTLDQCTVSIETDAMTAHEVIETMIASMVAMGFQQSSVRDALAEVLDGFEEEGLTNV